MEGNREGNRGEEKVYRMESDDIDWISITAISVAFEGEVPVNCSLLDVEDPNSALNGPYLQGFIGEIQGGMGKK